MAHFAKVINNRVEQVIVVDPEVILSGIFGSPSMWIQTSYNTYAGNHNLNGIPLRKNYACVGYAYDALRDAFIPVKPHSSWILDENTCLWKAPVNKPQDGQLYVWNEQNINWDLVLN